MMDNRTHLIGVAERLFDRHGFTATGMDRLTKAAGMSSRTLYKLAGSKTALMAAVLSERDRRFMQSLDVNTVKAIFASLEDWVRDEGARGCLFLRTHGETGGDTAERAEIVTRHKAAMRAQIAKIVALDLGGAVDAAAADTLTEQILVLVEGATATAVYRGPTAIAAAREAAGILLAAARQ